MFIHYLKNLLALCW